MNNILDLFDKIIMQLNNKIETEKEPKKLVFLLEKYQKAKNELISTGKIETVLCGSVRAYLDSYSDYMNNPLLDDMYEMEKYVKKME